MEIIVALFACIFFTYIAGFVHLFIVDSPARGDIAEWHQKVLAGNAESPNQYRPGAYLLAELMRRAFSWNIVVAYNHERMLFTFAMGFLSFFFYRRFLPYGWSLAAIGWFYAVLPYTYIGYGHQPADPIFAMFFVLGYLAMAYGAPSWVILISATSAFFRETSILIPLYGLFIEFNLKPLRGVIVRFMLGIVGVILVYGLIRWFYGPAEHPDPWIMLGINIEDDIWRRYFLTLTLLPGVLVIWCWKGLDPFLKRSMYFLLVFLIIHFIFARFGETRLLLPMMPLLICSALAGLRWKLGTYDGGKC